LTERPNDPLPSNTALTTGSIKPVESLAFTSSRRVTLLARYTGRHVRQSRHGAWENKKRSQTKPARQLLPAFAALAVAGVLIGGGGLVIKFGAPNANVGLDASSSYDPADYPPADRDALAADRSSRNETRLAATVTPGSTTAGAPSASKTTPPPARTVTSQLSTSKTTKPASSAGVGNAAVISTGTCQASFYGEPQQTANGETFNPAALTAAHKTLPFNTMVRVTNVANGKSVVVRINDRGPYVSGRCLDLSTAAFSAIASTSAGVANVKYDVLG
jgi:rare lipoprotein A